MDVSEEFPMVTQISRHDLEAKALSAVRCEPGCNGVKTLKLETVKIVNEGSTEWHLEIVDPGDVDPAVLYRAADRVKEALAEKYDLVDT
jgi:hypothetical protein